MPADFSLRHDPHDGGRHVIAVSGEIDLYTAPDLKAVLSQVIEEGATGVVIDLSGTTFLDSTGLGVLIGALKRLRSRDGALAVVNVDDSIARTFEITGLDQIFVIRGSRDEALAALGADASAA
jgi:anti-sigma B factor antagonist